MSCFSRLHCNDVLDKFEVIYKNNLVTLNPYFIFLNFFIIFYFSSIFIFFAQLFYSDFLEQNIA